MCLYKHSILITITSCPITVAVRVHSSEGKLWFHILFVLEFLCLNFPWDGIESGITWFGEECSRMRSVKARTMCCREIMCTLSEDGNVHLLPSLTTQVAFLSAYREKYFLPLKCECDSLTYGGKINARLLYTFISSKSLYRRSIHSLKPCSLSDLFSRGYVCSKSTVVLLCGLMQLFRQIK